MLQKVNLVSCVGPLVVSSPAGKPLIRCSSECWATCGDTPGIFDVSAKTMYACVDIFIAVFTTAFHLLLVSSFRHMLQKLSLRLDSLPYQFLLLSLLLLVNDQPALFTVPGVTSRIIGTGVKALKQAFADSLSIIQIIADCMFRPC